MRKLLGTMTIPSCASSFIQEISEQPDGGFGTDVD
jgi:hypothetical protein